MSNITIVSKIRSVYSMFRLIPHIIKAWYRFRNNKDEIESIGNGMNTCEECAITPRFKPCEKHQEQLDEIFGDL